MAVYSFKETKVYIKAFEMAMEIFELTKKFPSEEKYSLTDQIRRSSRSVCANIAEAFRKNNTRHISYPKYLMQVWKILKL